MSLLPAAALRNHHITLLMPPPTSAAHYILVLISWLSSVWQLLANVCRKYWRPWFRVTATDPFFLCLCRRQRGCYVLPPLLMYLHGWYLLEFTQHVSNIHVRNFFLYTLFHTHISTDLLVAYLAWPSCCQQQFFPAKYHATRHYPALICNDPTFMRMWFMRQTSVFPAQEAAILAVNHGTFGSPAYDIKVMKGEWLRRPSLCQTSRHRQQVV